jgi:hypothetical protein
VRMTTFLILFLVASVAALEERPVNIHVIPGGDSAPGAFLVRAIVQPHERNRALTISIESVGYRESTTLPLYGMDGPRARVVTFDDLPVGDYVIAARVQRKDGSIVEDERDVRVYAEVHVSQHIADLTIRSPAR